MTDPPSGAQARSETPPRARATARAVSASSDVSVAGGETSGPANRVSRERHEPHVTKRHAGVVPEECDATAVGGPDGCAGCRADERRQRGDPFDAEARWLPRAVDAGQYKQCCDDRAGERSSRSALSGLTSRERSWSGRHNAPLIPPECATRWRDRGGMIPASDRSVNLKSVVLTPKKLDQTANEPLTRPRRSANIQPSSKTREAAPPECGARWGEAPPRE